MKVKFNTSCVTLYGKYVKGRTYELSADQAKQFVKEGLAVSVEKQASKQAEKPKPKTTRRRRTSKAKAK